MRAIATSTLVTPCGSANSTWQLSPDIASIFRPLANDILQQMSIREFEKKVDLSGKYRQEFENYTETAEARPVRANSNSHTSYRQMNSKTQCVTKNSTLSIGQSYSCGPTARRLWRKWRILWQASEGDGLSRVWRWQCNSIVRHAWDFF